MRVEDVIDAAGSVTFQSRAAYVRYETRRDPRQVDPATTTGEQGGRAMDDAAFDAFYAAQVRRLVGQLYAMTGNLAEAQDCVQDAFVKAWLHRRRLEADGNPEAWVRTTAWRIAVSRWRRSTATLRAYRRHGVPADAPEPQPPDTELTDALRALVPEQRRAIVLHYLCDLSVSAIAAETGARPGTVRVRLSRGRAALAERLGGGVEDDRRLDARDRVAATGNRTSAGRHGGSREVPHA